MSFAADRQNTNSFLAGVMLVDLQKLYFIEKDVLRWIFSSVNWLKPYLSNGKFQVSIKNRCLNFTCINCGVLQGSILGSLL